MYQRSIFHIAALALLCGSGFAQAQTAVTSDQSQEQEKLTTGRNTWDSKLFSNYEYHFSQACDTCSQQSYPWIVQITPGQAAGAVDLKDGYRGGALSIAQVFDKIQAAITNPSDKVEAFYDAINGYPTRYKIQPGAGMIVSASIYNFFTHSADQKTLYQNARNLWASTRIDSYDFQYTDLGPNTQNIMWPLYVKVRKNVISETKDANGNIVKWDTASLLTINEWFDEIKKQLDSGSPYLDNTYNSIKGYSEQIHAVASGSLETKEFRFENYRDSGLS